MVSQREIAKYLKQVRKGCPAPYRRKLMTEIRNNLSEFLDDRPECTMEDILKHFGPPEKFADEYLLAMEDAERRTILHKAKWIKLAVCFGTAMIILIVAIAAIWIVYENSQSVIHYSYDEIIEQTYWY